MLQVFCRSLLLLLALAYPALAQHPAARPLPPVPDSLKGLMQRASTPAQRQRAWQRAADAFSDYGDTTRALAYARASYALAERRHDPAGQGAALNAVGYTYITQGRLRAAVAAAQQALLLHQGRGWATSQLVLGMAQMKLQDPAAALLALRAAHRAYGTAHDVAGQLRIDTILGTLYLNRNLLDSADACYVRAARGFARLPGFRNSEATALGNLGVVSNARRHYALAARYSRQALALRRLDHDSSFFSASFNALAVSALEQDSLPRALAYARQALWLTSRFGPLDGKLASLSNVGTAHGRLHHPDSALHYYRRGLALAQQGGAPTWSGDFLYRAALVQHQHQRLAGAWRDACLAEALDSTRRTRSTSISTLELLGQLAHERHDDAAALDYFQRQRKLERRNAAASSSREIAALRVQFDTERTEQALALTTARAATEAQRAEAQTQRATALRLLGQQQAAAYRDTLNRRQRLLLTQQLLAARQTSRAAQAGQQVLALRQQTREQAQQARLQAQAARLQAQQQELATLRARQQALGVAALAALVLVGGGLWFGRYRQRQAAARAAAETQLRQQIAADLHDDVGSLLTQVSLQSDLLSQGVLPADQQPAQLQHVAATSREAVRHMSDVVWGLSQLGHAPTLGPLLDRMHDHAHAVLPPAGLDLNFPTDPALRELPVPTTRQHALFLIYKEALHNAVKHARQATEITVAVRHEAGHLELAIRDDGQAATVPAARPGHGLGNMPARAQAVGGTVRYEAGAGFGVVARLPLG